MVVAARVGAARAGLGGVGPAIPGASNATSPRSIAVGGGTGAAVTWGVPGAAGGAVVTSAQEAISNVAAAIATRTIAEVMRTRFIVNFSLAGPRDYLRGCTTVIVGDSMA